jgi:hypothetical protein
VITIDLAREPLDVRALLALARREPVLVMAEDGELFMLSEADDFDEEVSVLRSSQAFQRFLDERSRSPHLASLDDLDRDIDRDLAAQRQSDAP